MEAGSEQTKEADAGLSKAISTRRTVGHGRKRDAILFYCLFAMMGVTSWLLVNAIFLQLPFWFLVTRESYSIVYYLAVSIQIGNALAVAYVCIVTFREKRKSKTHQLAKNLKRSKWLSWMRYERTHVAFIYALAIVTSIFLILVSVFPETPSYSIRLWFASALAGGVGALSNVIMWSYVASFEGNLIIGLSIGMGFSSIIPSIFAAIQQPGYSPVFSTPAFFSIMLGVIVFSLVSFIIIEKFSSKDREFVQQNSHDVLLQSDLVDPKDTTNESPDVIEGKTSDELSASNTSNYPVQRISSPYLYHRFVIFFMACLNFFIYGVLPYFTLNSMSSDLSSRLDLWMMIAGMTAQPLGRLLCLFVKVKHIFPTVGWIAHLCLFGCFFVFGRPVTACPWLLIPIVFFFNLIFGFTVTILFKMAAKEEEISRAKHLCRFLGLFEQLGACLSACLAVVLGKFVMLG